MTPPRTSTTTQPVASAMASATSLASSAELDRTFALIRRFFLSCAETSSNSPWPSPSLPTLTVGSSSFARLISSFLASFSLM